VFWILSVLHGRSDLAATWLTIYSSAYSPYKKLLKNAPIGSYGSNDIEITDRNVLLQIWVSLGWI
jgi:hypothetical protein